MDTFDVWRMKKAKRLKIAGAVILLGSFVAQNFVYDRWDSERQKLQSAIGDRAMIDKGALLNEVLYFVANLPYESSIQTDEVRRFKINQAATKTAMSSAIVVKLDDSLTDQEKTALTNELFAGAKIVHDYNAYVKLIQTVNEEYSRYSDNISATEQDLGRKREQARYIYLSLYVFGSFLLVVALAYE